MCLAYIFACCVHSPLELSVVYIRTYIYSPYLPAQSACMHPQSAVLNPLAIKVTFWPFQTLKQKMVHLRDPGVLYSIPCSEGSSPGRAPTGSTEWGCVRFSNCWTCVCCWSPGGSLKATIIDTHSRPDLLSPRVLAYPAWIGPLNRGKGTLPRLNATVLDWQCIRLTCLLYLFVLAGSMHVNLFSSLHVMNLLVDYITF